jgi:hypothetical protein
MPREKCPDCGHSLDNHVTFCDGKRLCLKCLCGFDGFEKKKGDSEK